MRLRLRYAKHSQTSKTKFEKQMKRILTILSAVFAAAICFTSCKKEPVKTPVCILGELSCNYAGEQAPKIATIEINYDDYRLDEELVNELFGRLKAKVKDGFVQARMKLFVNNDKGLRVDTRYFDYVWNVSKNDYVRTEYRVTPVKVNAKLDFVLKDGLALGFPAKDYSYEDQSEVVGNIMGIFEDLTKGKENVIAEGTGTLVLTSKHAITGVKLGVSSYIFTYDAESKSFTYSEK